MSVASRVLCACVGAYRKYISPLKAPCCRFAPTCSQYAIEALEVHGAVKGGLMSLWRVLRCNPFGKGGYDPVKPLVTNPAKNK